MGSKRPAPATAAAAAAAPGAVCVRSTLKRHAVCPAALKRPKRPTGSPTTAGNMAPAQLGNPETFPGFATMLAQGLEGADFECAGSMLPGICAFQSAFDAVAVCAW